jgi:predicted DNA-binding transcriptional regulator AlpA
VPDHTDSLQVLTAAALAAAVGVSLNSLRKRELPKPIHFGGKKLWLRSEVEHLIPEHAASRDPDLLRGAELAAKLGTTVSSLYSAVKRGDLPPPIHRDGKSYWSARAVARHLAALPRD